MSPDSPLGKLAQRVSALEQRVEDLVGRFSDRIGDLAAELRRYHDEADNDVRSFAPAVQEIHEVKAGFKFVGEQILGLRADVAALDHRIDDEREQRLAGQEERRREMREIQEASTAAIERVQREAAEALRDAISEREKQNRELKNRITLALLSLVGLFVTSGATLLAALLGGGGH